MDLNIFLIYHEKCNANTPNIDITDLPLLQDGGVSCHDCIETIQQFTIKKFFPVA